MKQMTLAASLAIAAATITAVPTTVLTQRQSPASDTTSRGPTLQAVLPERTAGRLPRYPDDAQRRGIGGVVTLTAVVDKSGKVLDVKVVRSIPTLEAAAVAAVKEWRYKPPVTSPLTIFLLFDATTARVDEPRRIPPQGPQPKRTKQVPAAYPASIGGNRPGNVVLDVVVNSAGRVVETRVKSGTSGFEGAAREAVRQWEYEPLVVNGTAVPFVATVTVLFSR